MNVGKVTATTLTGSHLSEAMSRLLIDGRARNDRGCTHSPMPTSVHITIAPGFAKCSGGSWYVGAVSPSTHR